MRRFSQRNSLVTLSEINITPLLDLAFVLLIIFVITTPMLEQTIDLTLPAGGAPDKNLHREDIRVVEISPKGFYLLGGKQMTLSQIEVELKRDFKAHPNLVVQIRAGYDEKHGRVTDVINRCQRNGIRFAFKTVPEK